MKRIISKKNTYLLALFIICLLGIVIVPTYAKFGSNYTTPDDIVGMSLTFNLSISNIEEYEEIVVPAGEVEQFNVEITNSTGNTAYYGVWYQMVEPTELTDDMFIGKIAESVANTSGSINNGDKTTVSLAIENGSNSDVKIYVGISSSTTGTNDIEYLGGKKLITGDMAKAVSCVTGGTTTYYAMLNTALNNASTTEDTTCTLLKNMTEEVSTDIALYNTTIDLNGNTLTGTITNSNTASTMRLKNGTLTASTGEKVSAIINKGKMYIESGTYSNVGNWLITNQSSGSLYITGGKFTLNTSTNGAVIVNNGSKNVKISNATVTSNGHGIGNNGTGADMVIDNSTITTTNSKYSGFYNGNGGANIFNTTLNGEYSLQNDGGSLYTWDTSINGLVSGPVPNMFHRSSTQVGLDIYNISADRCATWTSDGGQDDLIWYNTASYTNSYQTYSYTTIDYSNHNSTTSAYATHCYSGSTFTVGIAWYWDFRH